ncbi:DUF4854 domain-containing protein [Bifidobacterium bifidum]|uniref:DUF4854 domain-containing protein n=1 Tax=Bifidobacterium bifidum TaxID=1681 RepID=UPI003CFDD7CE
MLDHRPEADQGTRREGPRTCDCRYHYQRAQHSAESGPGRRHHLRGLSRRGQAEHLAKPDAGRNPGRQQQRLRLHRQQLRRQLRQQLGFQQWQDVRQRAGVPGLPEGKAGLEAAQSSGGDAGITTDLKADGDMLIYEFKLDSSYSDPSMFADTVDNMGDYYSQLAGQLDEEIDSANGVKIRTIVTDADGDDIVDKTYSAN